MAEIAHKKLERPRQAVALATELTNSFLFTADGAGYLKVWDICQFLNVARLDQRSNIIELAHWRAHDGCITSLDYVEKHRLILSSSSDTRIKMWRFDSLAEHGVTLAGVLGEQDAAGKRVSGHEAAMHDMRRLQKEVRALATRS